jgi:hypothetical protein
MRTEEATRAGPPPDQAAGRRRRVPVVPILVLVAIVGGLLWLLMIRSSPAQQVRRLIDKQLKLTIAGRYDLLYETLSPKAKAACSQDPFVGALQEITASRPEFWTLLEYRDIHIEVTGNQAVVTYVITYNGAPVERATPSNPDLYVRASRTIYGPVQSVAQQLEILEHLRKQAIVVGKEYDKERAEIIRHGPIKPVESVKGQWYDDLDQHVRCG